MGGVETAELLVIGHYVEIWHEPGFVITRLVPKHARLDLTLMAPRSLDRLTRRLPNRHLSEVVSPQLQYDWASQSGGFNCASIDRQQVAGTHPEDRAMIRCACLRNRRHVAGDSHPPMVAQPVLE